MLLISISRIYNIRTNKIQTHLHKIHKTHKLLRETTKFWHTKINKNRKKQTYKYIFNKQETN